MQRGLSAKLYDWSAGNASDGSNPGASSRGRCPARHLGLTNWVALLILSLAFLADI